MPYEDTLAHLIETHIFSEGDIHATRRCALDVIAQMALVLATRAPDELCAVRTRVRGNRGEPSGDTYDDDFAALAAYLHAVVVPPVAPWSSQEALRFREARAAAHGAAQALYAELHARLLAGGVFERSLALSVLDHASDAARETAAAAGIVLGVPRHGIEPLRAQLAEAPTFTTYTIATLLAQKFDQTVQDAIWKREKSEPEPAVATTTSSTAPAPFFKKCLAFGMLYARADELHLDAALLAAHAAAQRTLAHEAQWLAARAVETLMRADGAWLDAIAAHVAKWRPRQRDSPDVREHEAKQRAAYPEIAYRYRMRMALGALV
jgi:hypothetical protein